MDNKITLQQEIVIPEKRASEIRIVALNFNNRGLIVRYLIGSDELISKDTYKFNPVNSSNIVIEDTQIIDNFISNSTGYKQLLYNVYNYLATTLTGAQVVETAIQTINTISSNQETITKG